MTTSLDGVTEPDVVDLFVRAVALFGEQLVAVADTDWDLPTPCDGWEVAHVAAHVVVGESQLPALFAGESVAEIQEFDPRVLGPDPVAAWRGTALAAIEAVRAPGALDMILDHPIGRLPGRHVMGFRITDNLVHAWDIARAGGGDLELPDDIAEWCLDFWLPMAPGLAGSGYFAAMVEPAPEATPGERLLALLGRRAP
ncbi:MAG: TIGR03086 family protein [Acidimicrobiales bacterium]|nr:TIGR03086 family protein [Acidimicrobiales bacterium]